MHVMYAPKAFKVKSHLNEHKMSSAAADKKLGNLDSVKASKYRKPEIVECSSSVKLKEDAQK